MASTARRDPLARASRTLNTASRAIRQARKTWAERSSSSISSSDRAEGRARDSGAGDEEAGRRLARVAWVEDFELDPFELDLFELDVFELDRGLIGIGLDPA